MAPSLALQAQKPANGAIAINIAIVTDMGTDDKRQTTAASHATPADIRTHDTTAPALPLRPASLPTCPSPVHHCSWVVVAQAVPGAAHRRPSASGAHSPPWNGRCPGMERWQISPPKHRSCVRQPYLAERNRGGATGVRPVTAIPGAHQSRATALVTQL